MKKWYKVFVVSVLALSLVLFAVGCGDDDDEVVDETPVVATVTVDPATGTILEGETQQFTAAAADAAGAEITGLVFTWTSSNDTIATVDENGLGTGVAVGEVTITATVSEISGSATLTVNMDYPTSSLVSVKVIDAPTDDAVVDALWADVAGLDIATVVAAYDIEDPDIWWDEYEGMTIDVNLKSVYTDNDIYFLYTWNDAEDSKTRQAWYYNETNSTWLQMGKKHPDEFGNDPAYEDKFTVFWEINNSIPSFKTVGCANLCHIAKMATNNLGELADIWHWKRDRTAPVSQVDDKYLDNEENGRHGDDGTGAYSDNKQSLITTAGDTMDAPAYWIPGRTDYHWIMQTEIDDGTAIAIVDFVDGTWVDADGTALVATDFGYDSNLVIPSLMGIKPATGSRGEVSAWENWADGTWTLKIKRARATETTLQDVQFTETNTPYWFSIGVMNAAAIAHATPEGLTGTSYPLYLAP